MDEVTNWIAIQFEWETTNITFKDLADKHDLKIGTLKSRRSREKWIRISDATEKDATPKKDASIKSKKVATPKKKKPHKRRSGNPNPANQFSERNNAATKHGLFSRYIPQATLDIMGTLDKSDPADIMWDQIQIQYAAIIRAQQVMFVHDEHDHLREESGSSNGAEGSSVSYKVAFAHERHQSFLNAQSRAIGELRTSIKQFNEMTYDEDERNLKLSQMQTNITKAETETTFIEERTKLLTGKTKDTSLLDALIEVAKE